MIRNIWFSDNLYPSDHNSFFDDLIIILNNELNLRQQRLEFRLELM